VANRVRYVLQRSEHHPGGLHLRLQAGADNPDPLDQGLERAADITAMQELLDAGWRAADAGQYAEARAAFEQVIQRFGDVAELESRVRVV
jgi:hypothetical protein